MPVTPFVKLKIISNDDPALLDAAVNDFIAANLIPRENILSIMDSTCSSDLDVFNLHSTAIIYI